MQRTGVFRIWCAIILVAAGICPVAALTCDAPPVNQTFVVQTGGCNQTPAVIPCSETFLFPGAPSPAGDPVTQYYLDFGTAVSPISDSMILHPIRTSTRARIF